MDPVSGLWPSINRLAAFSLLILGSSLGCARHSSSPQPGPVPVVATSPVVVPLVEWDEYVGRIDAIEEVEVRARVSGHLDSTHFVEGQIVNKGDLLIILDQRPFRIAKDLAEADVASAKARAEEASAQLKQAEAERQSTQAQHVLSVQMVERAQRLVNDQAINQEELEVRQSKFRQTQADLEVKSARISLATAAVVTAEADSRAAEARLASARLNLEYTEVRAPVTGRVSNRNVTDGNLISGGTEQSTLLTTIVSLDPIHCYFDAGEQLFLKYVRLVEAGKLASFRNAKLPVYVGLSDESAGFPHQGHLDFVDNRLDRKTATMRGRAIFPNPDLILTPGLFAKVRVPGSARYDAVLIPESSIGTDQSEKFVLIIDAQNKVVRQKVTIGPRARGLRIVRTGLTGNEQIILRGLQRVRPGSVVSSKLETTVAVDDGLPNEAEPVPMGKWLPSYGTFQSRRMTDQKRSAVPAGVSSAEGGMGLKPPGETSRFNVQVEGNEVLK